MKESRVREDENNKEITTKANKVPNFVKNKTRCNATSQTEEQWVGCLKGNFLVFKFRSYHLCNSEFSS